LKEDIAGKLASMKKAISYSSDFMQSIDLDNATYEKAGLKLLETANPEIEYKLTTPTVSNVIGGANNYNDLLK
jgi:hypothetical protein